jgi:hypothetical protein
VANTTAPGQIAGWTSPPSDRRIGRMNGSACGRSEGTMITRTILCLVSIFVVLVGFSCAGDKATTGGMTDSTTGQASSSTGGSAGTSGGTGAGGQNASSQGVGGGSSQGVGGGSSQGVGGHGAGGQGGGGTGAGGAAPGDPCTRDRCIDGAVFECVGGTLEENGFECGLWPCYEVPVGCGTKEAACVLPGSEPCGDMLPGTIKCGDMAGTYWYCQGPTCVKQLQECSPGTICKPSPQGGPDTCVPPTW